MATVSQWRITDGRRKAVPDTRSGDGKCCLPVTSSYEGCPASYWRLTVRTGGWPWDRVQPFQVMVSSTCKVLLMHRVFELLTRFLMETACSWLHGYCVTVIWTVTFKLQLYSCTIKFRVASMNYAGQSFTLPALKTHVYEHWRRSGNKRHYPCRRTETV